VAGYGDSYYRSSELITVYQWWRLKLRRNSGIEKNPALQYYKATSQSRIENGGELNALIG
jgi:hypothetical protein